MDARRVISKQPRTIDLAKSIERKYRFILVNATLLFQFSSVSLSCRKIASLDYADYHKNSLPPAPNYAFNIITITIQLKSNNCENM